MIDTFSILRFLVDSERLDISPVSSAKAFRKFSIHVEERHSALGDAVATAKLYAELIKYITLPQ